MPYNSNCRCEPSFFDLAGFPTQLREPELLCFFNTIDTHKNKSEDPIEHYNLGRTWYAISVESLQDIHNHTLWSPKYQRFRLPWSLGPLHKLARLMRRPGSVLLPTFQWWNLHNHWTTDSINLIHCCSHISLVHDFDTISIPISITLTMVQRITSVSSLFKLIRIRTLEAARARNSSPVPHTFWKRMILGSIIITVSETSMTDCYTIVRRENMLILSRDKGK